MEAAHTSCWQLARTQEAAQQHHAAQKYSKKPKQRLQLRVLLVAPLLFGAALLASAGARGRAPAGPVTATSVELQGPPNSCSGPARLRHLTALAGPRTDAPMAVLPPFEPTCFVAHQERERVQCPVIDCSLDVSCTTTNTSCCAFINLQQMLFLDAFLSSKGFEGEYTLVYGSALGAARNHTILGHTSDVDFAFTPRVALFLERNSIKQEVWEHGYSLWADRTVWRMCPHVHHPSPDFQHLMETPIPAFAHYAHAERTGAPSGSCWLDGFLMIPVPGNTTNCTRSDPSINIQQMLEAGFGQHASTGSASVAAEPEQPGAGMWDSSSSSSSTAAGTIPAGGNEQTFCVHRGTAPVVIKRGLRPACVDGHRLPAPADIEGHLKDTYGAHWRTPDLLYHGTEPDTPDVDRVRTALQERLSVTEWGHTPYTVRRRRCNIAAHARRQQYLRQHGIEN